MHVLAVCQSDQDGLSDLAGRGALPGDELPRFYRELGHMLRMLWCGTGTSACPQDQGVCFEMKVHVWWCRLSSRNVRSVCSGEFVFHHTEHALKLYSISSECVGLGSQVTCVYSAPLPPSFVHICLTALHTINNQRESFIAVWSEWMWAVWVECFFQWAVDRKHVVVQGIIPPRLLLFTIATCNMRSVLSPHSYFQDEELFHILLTGRKERVRGMCVEVKCSVEMSKLCRSVWFYWPYREPCNAGGEKKWVFC